MCQFAEPWLAKEIAGVTERGKKFTKNRTLMADFPPSPFHSCCPDMAQTELREEHGKDRIFFKECFFPKQPVQKGTICIKINVLQKVSFKQL